MNLAAMIDGHPDDAVALISRGKDTTYGDLRGQVARLRGGLVRSGIAPGDRVAVIAANNWYFVVSYLAVLGTGAIAVPLNPASPAPEITREIAAIEAKAVIAGPTGQRVLADVDRSAVPSLVTVIQAGGDPVFEDALLLDDLMDGDAAPMIDRAGDDLAVLIFTSGTAGYPKAAMLTHGNLSSNIEQVQQNVHRRSLPEDVAFGVLPMFHIYGLNVLLGVNLTAGATVLLVERFDPQSGVDSVMKHAVTTIAGAPAMWAAWAHLPDAPGDAFGSVRLAASGAAKLAPAVRERFFERFSLQISEGYGLTEASPVVTNSAGLPAPPGSIGAPLPGVRLRLVDSDGKDVLVGDVGEIHVRGPNVFAGYWNDPEATAGALTPDGWLKTGDMAMVDENGFLFLVDRLKDLVIVSGFNVYPAEVERVLGEHPGVAAAAVVGVKHPHTGEAVKAYVVTQPGKSVEEDAIIRFCEERLARYKCPDKVWFVDELPLGLGGKVRKHELG